MGEPQVNESCGSSIERVNQSCLFACHGCMRLVVCLRAMGVCVFTHIRDMLRVSRMQMSLYRGLIEP